MPRPRFAALQSAGWLFLFVLAAVMNSGGYRYGASDQAFYIPAILHHADPSLFPRDWAMLGAQDRFNAFTPLAGWMAGLGISLPGLFLALYLAALVLLGVAALSLGRAVSASRWTGVAVLFALALRHAVALGAVNTLEGYMHPRLPAFALGALAVAALLHRRTAVVVALLVASLVVHPTTAIWFALMAGTGLFVADRRWRPWIGTAAAAGVVAAAWAVFLGPLAPLMVRMDAEWLSVLQGKRYLFPDRWPASEWLVVSLYVAVIAFAYRARSRAGLASARESGIVAGGIALLAILAVSLPFTFARVAFAVQLQVPRVLWLVDLLAVLYLVWFLAEGRPKRGQAPFPGREMGPGPISPHARPAVVALVILALAFARGTYVSFVEHPERRLVGVDLPSTEWTRTLAWISEHSPVNELVLADPGHAWRYGTSVRVGARRDVLLEEAKDSAMAMYSRETAVLVLDRIRALEDFGSLTPDRARDLASRYGAGLMITTLELDLPLVHREGTFRIYALTRSQPPPAA